MRRLTVRWRIALSLAAAIVFGFCVAVLKGQEDGLRDAIGNLSGPWLLVAFWCASLSRRRSVGAAVGAAATVLALGGFCVGLSVISDYGTTSAAAALRLAFHANLRYFEAGVISGPLLGAIGATARRHAANRLLVSGAVLLAEPIAIVVMRRSGQFEALVGYWSGFRTSAYFIESVVGALLVAAALATRKSSASSPDAADHP